MVLPYLIAAAIAAGLIKKAHEEEEVRVIIKYKEKDKLLGYTELQFENDLVRKEEVVEKHDGTVIKHLPLIDGSVAIIKRKDIEKLKEDIDVEYVEIDQPVYALDFALQESVILQEDTISQKDITSLSEEITWAVKRVNAHNYHQITKGKGIKVAVIDSGIDATHPDLVNNVKGGYDFINDNDYIYDDCNHGTKVAGIIAAENNNIGVLGIAPESSIYSLRVMQFSSTRGCYGWTSTMAEAVEWSIENNMDIINLSLGGSGYSYTNETAVNKAYDAGILIIAGAGNNGNKSECNDNECILYPAALDNVIAVSATTANDYIASFSSRGTEVELTAPGYNISTTSNGGGYRPFSGTSCASPVIAGVAALLMSTYPEKTNVEIREKLIEIAEDLGQEGRDIVYGHGIPVLLTDNEDEPEPEPEPELDIDVLITKEYESIKSESSMDITTYTSSNSVPLSDVNVLIEIIDISTNYIAGSTGMTGNFSIQYTAPIIENEINVTLKVTVDKIGYNSKTVCTTFKVTPKEKPEPCVPNWQCETPLNGYESDGCGNRRYSAACEPEPEPEPEIIESPHNYDDYYDNTWVIYNENTTQGRIRFSRLETEPDFDYVIIYDKYDNEIIRYDGINNDTWTPWINGDTIKVRLISDKCITSYGFIIDNQEVIYDELSQIEIGIIEAPLETYPSIVNNIEIITTSENRTLDNVTVEMSVTKGKLSVYTGKTNSIGLFDFDFIAPNVSEQTSAVITIKVMKENYITEIVNISIFINPSVGYTLSIESPHPYPKGYYNTWIVTEPGANKLRAYVSKIVATYPDAMLIYDKYDNEIYGRSGSVYQGFWTPWVSGDTMKIVFDGTNGGIYGFKIDDIEIA